MSTFVENRGIISETEPVGLLTEGAAGIAVIVLAIVGLAGVSTPSMAAIATIVIGVGLMVQGFTTAAENSRVVGAAGGAVMTGNDFAGEVMVDCLGGGTGVVLGILALIGVSAAPMLMPAALIVFGGALLLSGALAMRTSPATGGMETLIGIGGLVLGILSLLIAHSAVLLLVGFIAIGAALLMVSAAFSGAVLRIFTTTTA